jgi:hypothetical protein
MEITDKEGDVGPGVTGAICGVRFPGSCDDEASSAELMDITEKEGEEGTDLAPDAEGRFWGVGG